jgi:hypothetical protein
MELRRFVVYDLRDHAAWLPAHAACRGAEGAASSRKKRRLSRQDLEALGATLRGSWPTA